MGLLSGNSEAYRRHVSLSLALLSGGSPLFQQGELDAFQSSEKRVALDSALAAGFRDDAFRALRISVGPLLAAHSFSMSAVW